ncbi:hypothetical protein [Streptomyces sp. NPDC059224]|uniref:hypothetical protein n=1 Tax=Streptomyces sp. NPDC059224 TaxID=3346775 RepID=UPI00369225CA
MQRQYSGTAGSLRQPRHPPPAPPGRRTGRDHHPAVCDALATLPVADESRAGYSRGKFKHWTDAAKNGCNARAEALLAEAMTAPEIGRLPLTGGTQWSGGTAAALRPDGHVWWATEQCRESAAFAGTECRALQELPAIF